jgi:hypothetical protein
MARRRCNACNGEYEDIGLDNMPYFHACPPVTVARVTRAGRSQTVPVSDVRATDQIVVLRNNQQTTIAAGDIQPTDTRIGDELAPRANARDENSALIGGEVEGTRRIRRIGAGATTLDPTHVRDRIGARVV